MSTLSTLPQNSGRLFLTDGGMETTLIFHEGVDLPHFAAYDLVFRPGGREKLRAYYETYVELATERGVGVVLETATWRASADWGARLGHSPERLALANRLCVQIVTGLRDERATPHAPVVVSGCVGPRGDGYDPAELLTAEESCGYHTPQVQSLAEAGVDLIGALTMTHVGEAVGIVRAARSAGLPVAISFTTETDGRLPSGETLPEAIAAVDAATDGYVAYYMINCAHPTHFAHEILSGAAWTERIRGLRVNASALSHAELDEAEELDDGDPADLGRRVAELRDALPQLNVLGGCCGTDHRHIAAIGSACGAAA